MLGRRIAGVVACAALVLVASCGGDDAAPATTESRGPAVEVEKTELTLVDTARPTPSDPQRDLPERPDRTLSVMVLAPTDPPDGAGYPLVVFAHGHSRLGTEYEELLSDWAEEGYVVAAPTFPLSSGPEATADDTMSYADVFNQPGDISFVVDELVARLPDLVDPDAVGVVGHSLGAITVLGLRNNTCCADPDIKAVVAVAGMTLPFAGDPVTESAPLLLVHGGTDPTVAVSGSEGIFADAAAPVSFLRFAEGGHDEVLDGGGDPAALTREAILAFFADHLRGDGDAWSTLAADVSAQSIATLQERL